MGNICITLQKKYRVRLFFLSADRFIVKFLISAGDVHCQNKLPVLVSNCVGKVKILHTVILTENNYKYVKKQKTKKLHAHGLSGWFGLVIYLKNSKLQP